MSELTMLAIKRDEAYERAMYCLKMWIHDNRRSDRWMLRYIRACRMCERLTQKLITP